MNRLLTVAVTCALAAASGAIATPPAPSSDGPQKARVDSRDRIICRRFVRIGTLAGGYRTCKTRAEWDREQANIRQMGVSDSCGQRGDGSYMCPK